MPNMQMCVEFIFEVYNALTYNGLKMMCVCVFFFFLFFFFCFFFLILFLSQLFVLNMCLFVSNYLIYIYLKQGLLKIR